MAAVAATDGVKGTGKCPVCGTESVPLVEVMEVLICQKCSARKGTSRIKKRIQEIFDRQLAQKKKESWGKRMDHVRTGVELYKAKKPAEALKHLREYVSILEQKYGTGPGGLFPGLFGNGRESAEIILVAGVYWDMAKIYDQMKGHTTEMRHCLNKFVEFSNNRRHAIIGSEALRKYLGSDQIINREDFKNVRAILTGRMKRCFVATVAFGEDSSEVVVLRQFRDEVLERSSLGRAFVDIYYRVGPGLATAVGRFSVTREFTRAILWPLVKIADLLL